LSKKNNNVKLNDISNNKNKYTYKWNIKHINKDKLITSNIIIFLIWYIKIFKEKMFC
jgi:hypothetical protein